MTEDKNSTGSPEAAGGANLDSASSASQARFISSRPPTAPEERPLASWVRVLANCDHPKSGCTSAVLVEPNDSRTAFCWCGACGAMRVPDDASTEWIRPGLAQILRDDDAVSAFERDMARLSEAAAELSKTATSLRDAMTDPADDRRADLSASADAVKRASAEIERIARTAFGGLVCE